MEEHDEFVQFSVEEQFIYRQACHDNGMFDVELAYQGASSITREALLKRCAHFCLDADAQDAEEAVRFLGRDKRARIQHLQQQLEIEAARAAHLSIWETVKHALLAEKAQHAEAEQFIHGVYRTSDHAWKAKDPEQKCFEMQIELYDREGRLRLRPEVHFKQPIQDAEVYHRLNFRHAVQHAVARRCCPQAERILSETMLGLLEFVGFCQCLILTSRTYIGFRPNVHLKHLKTHRAQYVYHTSMSNK